MWTNLMFFYYAENLGENWLWSWVFWEFVLDKFAAIFYVERVAVLTMTWIHGKTSRQIQGHHLDKHCCSYMLMIN